MNRIVVRLRLYKLFPNMFPNGREYVWALWTIAPWIDRALPAPTPEYRGYYPTEDDAELAVI